MQNGVTLMAKFADKLRDNLLDAMNDAYWEEYDRWFVRRHPTRPGRYDLVRNGSPEEVISLTKRDLHDCILSPGHVAGEWLKTYRGRAAMQAAVRMK